jgi:murein DD-endopeptidase MepM/ murein hydrolase activator NlpD
MGFATTYGHNSQLLVSVGDKVFAGDVIASSGNSGRSTGPHLHYEIRLNDTPVDPVKYLGLDTPAVAQ